MPSSPDTRLRHATRRSRATRVAVALLRPACAGARPPPTTPASPADEAALIASLRAKVPVEPPSALIADPYVRWAGQPPAAAPEGTVCAVRFEADGTHYRLATFPGADAARRDGFAPTHEGACGACSTLQDLAVYLERRDLTTPVRWCGVRLIDARALACLEALGFSRPCAQIWLYDARHTRHACFAVCMTSWLEGEASAGPDGRLNDCLRCDEERSGPIFKAVAGRTRRNSGIRSSIPRPDEEVAPVVHDYVPGPWSATGAPGQPR